jgi:hypothetical protein
MLKSAWVSNVIADHAFALSIGCRTPSVGKKRGMWLPIRARIRSTAGL